MYVSFLMQGHIRDNLIKPLKTNYLNFYLFIIIIIF